MRHKLIHIAIRVLLTILLLGHSFIVTRYTHTHIINGAIVVHAHFMSSDEEKTGKDGTPLHTHSSFEVIFLSMISNFIADEPQVTSIPPIAVHLIHKSFHYEDKQYRFTPFRHYDVRGSPTPLAA